MDSTFNFSIRRLPNGDALLCDGSGAPIACNAQGRVYVNPNGVPMTVDQWRKAKDSPSVAEERRPGLEEYHDLVGELLAPRLNLRTQQIECKTGAISEEEYENLNVWMRKAYGLKFNKADLQSTVRAIARKAAYDPIEGYLSSLGVEGEPVLSVEEWDQIAFLALGLKDSWSRTVVQRFLLSAVARVMQPGCKVDQCLILYGRQGLQKSTFFAALGGEHFSDSMGDLTHKKDDLLILHRNWINEWSESDSVFIGANKSEKIKRFVSSTEDTFRAPYGRTTQAYKRRSVLCGTTNRDDWANDPTGNRRFPVLSPAAIDAEWITTNRDRIWARVVVEWRKGSRWWFSKEEEDRISEQAAQFAPTNDDVEVAFTYLRAHPGEWVSTRDLLLLALRKDAEKLDHRQVSGFARQMSGLETRGVLKEKRNYQGRTAQSPTRIRTTCWSAVAPNE